MRKILLVDDDPELLTLLDFTLQSQGFEVLLSSNGQEALRMAYQQRPDLVVTDLKMPGMDGIELCQRLREMTEITIVVLSALHEQQTIVQALQVGADDYITKPYSMTELVARIRAKLQMYARPSLATQARSTLTVGDLQIDRRRRKVTKDGKVIALSVTEYNLLLSLARHQNKVVSHRQLLSEVWGTECVDELPYLRIYIHALRQKVETNPAQPQLIKSIRGAGYYLAT